MSTAASPPDALSLWSSALQAQDAATEQRSLNQLLALFQSQPGNIAPLFPTLVSMLGRCSAVFKQFIVDVIDLTFCKPTIGPQARSSLAYHMPEPLLALLNEQDLRHAKVAITAFASVYQPLFRLVCNDRTQSRLWPVIEAIKQRIVLLFDSSQHIGAKLAAIKAFQKIILVQTRPTDARGQVISKSAADANLSQIPADHAMLRPAPLEQEANERMKQIVYVIFTSPVADLVMASMNVMAILAKMRSSLSPIVFEALISWTPSALVSQPYVTVRSVEKTLRLLFQHFHPSRNSLAGSYASQIIEAVDNQKLRMDTAAREEEGRKREAAQQKRAAVEQSAAGTSTLADSPTKRKRVRFAGGDEEEAEQATETSLAATTAAVLGGDGQPPTLPTTAEERFENAMRLAASDPSDPNLMAAFDASTLPLPLVIDLVMANLEAISEFDLTNAIAQARARVNGEAIPSGLSAGLPAPGPPPQRSEAFIKREDSGAMDVDGAYEGVPQDPLKLDMGEEETLNAAERHLEETAAHDGQGESSVAMTNFTLRPPGELNVEDCKALLHASVERICQVGLREGGGGVVDARGGAGSSADATSLVENAAGVRVPPAQLWTILVTRLATRGFGTFGHGRDDEQSVAMQSQSDAVRKLMLDFVVADFPRRTDFALQWIAEEFYCHLKLRRQGRLGSDETSSYTIWLQRIAAAVIETMDSKDKTLHEFLNRVPLLTNSIISTLQALCLDKTKMAAGFTILRDLAIHRVPARTITCAILLGLARNVEKMVRGAAIITVRNWVRVNGQGNSPAGETLENDVLDFAKAGLRRLTVRRPAAEAGENASVPEAETKASTNGTKTKDAPAATAANGHNSEEIDEDADAEASAVVEMSALDDPEKEIELDSDVVRLVELPFALCVRVPDMLGEVFNSYAAMPPQVQQAVEKHITPLIQNLGANNAKLLSLIKDHPAGTDSLAVHVFQIMSEKQRSKKMVEIVKQMAEENANTIDPRFLIPILPDLEKAEIVKFLPRIVLMLSTDKAEDRTMLKNVFTSVVQPPEQGFGSVSTNLPRVRQSELLSPVELMSLLHHAEQDIGPQTAANAIRICFGMTEIFRSEVIGAVLNQLIEEPVLPVLLMRTAIIAVRTYKSLSSYIATNFLSRLITRKVWQQPLLWKGFVICVQQTAPASFNALVQLPREQLRDVVSRQPDLRTGLREHLIKRAGGNKARLKSFMELLGEGEDDAAAAAATATTSNTPGSGSSTPQHVV